MVDREAVYRLLQDKNFDEITKVIYQNRDLLGKDLVFTHAAQMFEAEFFDATDGLSDKEKLKSYERLWILIELEGFAVSETFKRRMVEEKLQLYERQQHKGLLDLASRYQHLETAQRIIDQIRVNTPEVIVDATTSGVSVKSTRVNDSAPRTIKLFKSQQEKHFFGGVKDAFPNYHHYPNVALSCVIDFEAIKERLTTEESDYFFKAVIDAVAFDTDDYSPVYFVELDSAFHDSTKAKKRDAMKERIFEAANVKLIRIRSEDKALSREDFKKLIKSLMAR